MTDKLIKEYIRKEKDLSEFKIKALQRTNKIYQKNLLTVVSQLMKIDLTQK